MQNYFDPNTSANPATMTIRGGLHIASNHGCRFEACIPLIQDYGRCRLIQHAFKLSVA